MPPAVPTNAVATKSATMPRLRARRVTVFIGSHCTKGTPAWRLLPERIQRPRAPRGAARPPPSRAPDSAGAERAAGAGRSDGRELSTRGARDGVADGARPG